MTDPGFTVERRQQTAPYLPRTTYSDYFAFRDAACSVLVEPGIALGLRRAAQRALPRETGGLLAGRSLRDDMGSYVVITGFVEAPEASGQPAAFKIPVAQLSKLRVQTAREYPGADEMGWWHSHPLPSRYSQVDVNTQTMFQRPDSVGLLIFAGSKPWLTAYIGPDARHLGAPAVPPSAKPDGGATPPPSAVRHAGDNGSASPDQEAESKPAAFGRGRAGARAPARSRVRRTIIILTIALLAVLVIPVVLTWYWVNGVKESLSQQMTGQLRVLGSHEDKNYQTVEGQLASVQPSPTPASAPPTLIWACAPTKITPGGNGPVTYTCTATGPPGTIQWHANGAITGTGSKANFTVSAPIKVQPYLLTSQGTFPGESQTLYP